MKRLIQYARLAFWSLIVPGFFYWLLGPNGFWERLIVVAAIGLWWMFWIVVVVWLKAYDKLHEKKP